MTSPEQIVIATSIPPRLSRVDAGRHVDGQYQQLCIQSWLDCGFRVLSVNDRDEVSHLQPLYPQVEFFLTERNASAICGRKNPFIVDLLSALLQSRASVIGIVNSDVVFEPVQAWQKRLPDLAGNCVVTGQRLETVSLHHGVLLKHHWGFDYFFFDRIAAQELAKERRPWAMGLPWWDYWLPLTLALSGRKIAAVNRPSIVHLRHGTAYNVVVWRQFAVALSDLIVRAAEASASPLPQAVAAVLPLCRELSKLVHATGAELDSAEPSMHRLADECSNTIARELIDLDGGSDVAAPVTRTQALDPGPARVFRDLEIRTEAGKSLERATRLEREGKTEEADAQYRSALNTIPDHPDALLAYGDLLMSGSKPALAAAVFRKLVSIRPDFCNVITELGVALDKMGRSSEAVACFERVIELDAEFAPVYFHLAMTLSKVNGHADAVARFEQLLARRPDVRAGAETYYRLRGQLRLLDGSANLEMKEYFSRHGEDALLDEFFAFKATGYFVDIGTGDGVQFSNSYIFEQRGWSGVCVGSSTNLSANRPRSRCAISPPNVEQGMSLMFADGVPNADFVSISSERGNPSLLSVLELERHRPRVLLISEPDEPEQKTLEDWLTPFGYRRARRLGPSSFYVLAEEDRRRMLAITVSALLARAPALFQSRYVYWPAVK